jgi:hypothetical protein
MLPLLPMLRILPLLPILRMEPVLPILRILPTLAILPKLPMLRTLAMLKRLNTLARLWMLLNPRQSGCSPEDRGVMVIKKPPGNCRLSAAEECRNVVRFRLTAVYPASS